MNVDGMSSNDTTGVYSGTLSTQTKQDEPDIIFSVAMRMAGLGPMKAGSVSANAAAPTAASFVWAPYAGPVDQRDGMGQNAGKQTASGAPLIEVESAPISNQWGYTGPASKNPYYSTPSNPLRDGLVKGFENWFASVSLTNKMSGEVTPVPSSERATVEGAQEAVRIVKMFDANAQLSSFRFGENGGPYVENAPTYEVKLSDGRTLNAGLVLQYYYHHGQGVDAGSDAFIASEVLG